MLRSNGSRPWAAMPSSEMRRAGRLAPRRLPRPISAHGPGHTPVYGVHIALTYQSPQHAWGSVSRKSRRKGRQFRDSYDGRRKHQRPLWSRHYIIDAKGKPTRDPGFPDNQRRYLYPGKGGPDARGIRIARQRSTTPAATRGTPTTKSR